jgi:hypothetical protein
MLLSCHDSAESAPSGKYHQKGERSDLKNDLSREKSSLASPAPSLWQREFGGIRRGASAAWSDSGVVACSACLTNERVAVLAPAPQPCLQRHALA